MQSLSPVLNKLCIAILLSLLAACYQTPVAALPTDPGGPGSYATGHVTITYTAPQTGASRAADIYFPAAGGAVDPLGAPYPAVVFAPGLAAGTGSYPGTGEHLASWGYVVVIPNFVLQSLDVRGPEMLYLFSYLEQENGRVDGLLHDKININRLGAAGHSMGGITALMAAARGAQLQAVVGLDATQAPGASPLGYWDYTQEGPSISAPVLLLSAPSHTCNNYASYTNMYPTLGATHEVFGVISGAYHCDFINPTDLTMRSACYMLCGGSYDEGRAVLSDRYMTAWFNYYLYEDSSFYTYIYGAQATSDVQAGAITLTQQTAPRRLAAIAIPTGVLLTWDVPGYAAIKGYAVYRRTLGGAYGDQPLVEVTGQAGSYTDRQLPGSGTYAYVVRSYDAGGNLSQPSAEVQVNVTSIATAVISPTRLPGSTVPMYLPLLVGELTR